MGGRSGHNTDELRKRTGKKYCDEAELVPLLLAQGLVHQLVSP